MYEATLALLNGVVRQTLLGGMINGNSRNSQPRPVKLSYYASIFNRLPFLRTYRDNLPSSLRRRFGVVEPH